MPIPAIIGTIASVLGWIGIDLGISWLTSDSTNVEYVRAEVWTSPPSSGSTGFPCSCTER